MSLALLETVAKDFQQYCLMILQWGFQLVALHPETINKCGNMKWLTIIDKINAISISWYSIFWLNYFVAYWREYLIIHDQILKRKLVSNLAVMCQIVAMCQTEKRYILLHICYKKWENVFCHRHDSNALQISIKYTTYIANISEFQGIVVFTFPVICW